MLDSVRRFIRRERMLQEGRPVWVAVSGGLDSMVLLHVLRELGYPCSVVHVDHGLRGAESDADRQFVEAHCQQLGLPFRALKVDAKAHAFDHHLSIQVAARELRYEWLGELWREQPMPIAMGHHADDAVESLLINLLRGTGAHGWSSIRPVSGIHVRPLSCVGREQIVRYAQAHQVPYREDSSNSDPKYLRNRIRHQVLPLLETMRPGASRAMSRSVHMLRELEEAARQLTTAELAGVSSSSDGTIRLPFERLECSSIPDLLLHHLLRPLGFHPDTLDRIRDAIAERSTGAVFSVGDHQACVDREALIITRTSTGYPTYVIDPAVSQRSGGSFAWSFVEGVAASVGQGTHEVWLDADRLSFPIVLRPWRAGDRIRPIGLGGSRSVSDILIDAKVPQTRKAGVHVLVSEGTVVWVVGHRIAEGYQSRGDTTSVLRIAHND